MMVSSDQNDIYLKQTIVYHGIVYQVHVTYAV